MYVALKIDKIEFYLCVEKQVSCTRMEGEKGLGTDISKTPIPIHMKIGEKELRGRSGVCAISGVCATTLFQ